MSRDDLFVGLDIGSTKVCAVIGEIDKKGNLEITGIGASPSTGLKKGVVVNIEATLRSVRTAIEEAEMMSGREVKSCWIGIGGSHIEGIISRGVVAVTGRNKGIREIGQDDIDRVMEAAKAVVIPMDRQILEVIPQSYIVDDQRGIRDPLDMIGVRLEAEVHIITCSGTGVQNIANCVKRADLDVNDLILQSLATARAVLTPDEMESGVVLIDLGGGTTDVLVYSEGAPYSTATIAAGGIQVTNDISILKNLSSEMAEKIKLEAGCCWEPFLEIDDEIIVPGVGGRPPLAIPRSHILQIVRPRMEEIFKMVKEKIDKLNFNRPLGAGIVITGGGAQLLGATELASEIFGLPVRMGSPRPMGGLVEEYRNPAYATATGLVLEAYHREGINVAANPVGEPRLKEKRDSIFEKLITWFKNEFL